MKRKTDKRKKINIILLTVVLLTGVSLLLYPVVSDHLNSLHQSRAIASYKEITAEMDDGTRELLWKEAEAYNQTLTRKEDRFHLSEAETEAYGNLLNVSGDGMMGYVEIPVIDVLLPVYHGTDEEILQVAIGHIEGTSLPVGGAGTHSVISGHRGLPSAKLFTDLDQLTEGDIFILHVLDETLTYEVDQIHIVEPEDISFLEIEEGKDLCTLMTCTPYGVNSHRLLVRGHRTENRSMAGTEGILSDAVSIDPGLVALVVALPVLLIILLAVLGISRRKFKGKR